jgi:threonine synthase
MLSFLRQIGVDAILEDSSGNGGSSMAGLGAAGGTRVKILAPASTSPAKIAQVRAYGAAVQLVEGPREESEAEAIRQSSQTFYASHNWQPFFLEGTKSLAYEIWEDLGFRAPDNIIVPVGAGSSLLGCAFGFRELLKAGQIAKLPRLFAAQPLNCSPIDASFKAGVDTPVAREVNKTVAEGTKSLAYEIWEDLGFRAPDNIIVPVGAGSSLLGCAFGFRELLKAGQIAKLPRLFAAQPLNCSPIDASFKAGVDTPVAREVNKTVAEGTAIKNPLRLREIIGSLRESGGGTVALTEDEIVAALRRLARQGLFAEPTSASAAAALEKLSGAGSIKANETTVAVLTGTGLKAATTVADLVQ